jgi:uncharacterized protein YfaS (alpha-2-macroglobulin family)
MRTKSFLLFAVLAIAVFISCNRKSVSLSETNAKNEVPSLGNLYFQFSKALAPDSLLNRWDSTDYVQFKPAIKGRFRWESPEQLVFSPSEPLSPATSYSAVIKDDILAHSSWDQLKTPDPISFHTAALKLENAGVTWVLQKESGGNAIPRLDLQFNYAVNPAAIKDKISVIVDGESKTFQQLTTGSARLVSFQINEVKSTDKDYTTKVTLAKGIIPEGGANATEDVISEELQIPSPFILRIRGVEAQHDGLTGTVKILTSQEVSPELAKSFIQLDPSAKFTVESEEDGLLISSDAFDADKTYELKLTKGLKGLLGGVLKEDYSDQVAFGELEPAVSFGNSKGLYLMAGGEKNISINIVNIPTVKIIISKVYESNLLAAQRYGYYPAEKNNQSEDEYYYGDDADYGSPATFGDVVYEKEIDTKSLPKLGNGVIFNFNPEERLPDFKGIYHIVVRSTKQYWVRDSRYLAISDIGLIAREAKDKLVVFANSIKSAEALNGVQLTAYGANNQVLGMGNTDAQGVAEIAYTRKEYAGFKPAMIIAKSAGDFNYLPFNTTRVNTSRFDVGGRSISPTGIDAFVYGERDIYRPGETLNASVILRDINWKSPGEIPVKMRLLMPNGKELKSLRKTTNIEGSAEIAVSIPADAYTGSYQLEVFSGNEVLLASKTFSVEEFVPDRIKVETALSKATLTPGDSAVLQITASNYFGPPAANRNYEYELQFIQKAFSAARYDRYEFELTNQTSFFDKVVKEGKTDDNGIARVPISVPAMYKQMGLLQANIYSTVFDETGRPVSRTKTVDIFTQPVFYGIGNDGYGYYALNQPVRFPVIALQKDGRPVQSTAKIQIIKHDYRTVLNKSDGYFRYTSQREDKIVKEENLNITGENSFYSFTPRLPGNYEIRVFAIGASTYVSKSFYSYGGWGDNSSFEVNTEGQIEIETDKQEYQAGEKANLLFKTPFSGRLLVTVESDHLQSWQYINVEKRSASVELPLQLQHLPNVYVTATLIKPHGESSLPLTVAHGYKAIRVESKERKLEVSIAAAANSRSRTKQQVTVKSAPGSFVTLAAVDDGVLAVTDMKTPDPYHWFYQKRSLAVNAYDLYPLLFPELRAKLSSTGGDGVEMKKRTNPMPNKRIKVVSYWSGIKEVNGSGEAKFELDIPGFSGSLRLMAVAYKGERLGSAESKMTIADPVVVSTGLPRFLSPGDTLTVPVTLTNTTKNPLSARVQLKLKGPIQMLGSSTASVDIAANSENNSTFRIFTQSKADTGSVRIDVQAAGSNYFEEIPITVRPASTLQKESGSGNIAGGSSKTIDLPLSRFIAGTTGYRLVVSRNPVTELSEQLAYLVQYPYGCSEQTVSAAFPQLYYSDLKSIGLPGKAASASAVANVQEAIRKIKMRQLYNGGITMWDEESAENWWVSAYAAHFLVEARKAGYDVDKSLIETLSAYLINKLRNRQMINYVYNRTQQKKIAPKEVAYSLYVLALAGKPQVSVMNYYKSNADWLSLDGKYVLAAGYAIAGDKKSFATLLPGSFSGEVSETQTGGSFYSPVRDEALALSTLVETDPANAQIPLMAKHVQEYLKQRGWLSTQERAFSFLALGKLARSAANSNATAQIKINGKIVATANGKTAVVTDKVIADPGSITIQTSGSGALYYSWEAEGIDAGGRYIEEDKFIKVRRQFYDRYGKKITGNNFNRNQLIIVGVTLENSYATPVDNIVITDLLPAGFEIENPRTKEIPGMDWIKNASSPTALDVRDDRIHFFVDLGSKSQVYYYAVRAVSPGTYKIGPVSADAMYNGEYHSYHGGGTVKINE